MGSTTDVPFDYKPIQQIYNSLTYSDTYGGSVILFICITLIVIAIVSYFVIRINIEPIKSDWVNQRCKPHIIPFAGMVQKEYGESIGDATKRNFDFCSQSILTKTTGHLLSPLTFITNSLTYMAEKIRIAINNIRKMIANVRDSMQNISEELMGRLINMMVPLQQIIISMRDMMSKIQGAISASFFTMLGSYMTLKSLLGAIAEFIVTILIVFAALIAGLWAVPFTWGFAAANTAIFVAISIPMAIILSFMKNTMHIDTNLSIPSVCFDENTLIRCDCKGCTCCHNCCCYCLDEHNEERACINMCMNGKQMVPIQYLNPGDLLSDARHNNKNYVTAVMKLKSPYKKMYSLNGTLVTGDHLVWFKDKLQTVSSHPYAIHVPNYSKDYVYCLNTSDKNINIRGTWFSDWDGLTEDECEQLHNICLHNNVYSTKCQNQFHECFDGGFFGDTMITMHDGKLKKINQVDVGDILDNNINVYGIVRVWTDRLETTASEYGYNIKWLNTNQNVRVNPIHKIPRNNSLNNETVVYHLLTNTSMFKVDGHYVMDYNAYIDTNIESFHVKK
jgi:hypothetical protein